MIMFICFCIVGVGNMFIDFCVFFFLIVVYVLYFIVQVCFYMVGIVNSYIWNWIWMFEVKKKVDKQEMIWFIVVNFVVFGMMFLLLFGF